MKVAELIKHCYDIIIIYKQINDMEFKDLYKGCKDNIPCELMESNVKCFGAKCRGITEIEIDA